MDCVMIDEDTMVHARKLMQLGLAEYDSLHVAAAIKGEADLFVTTDDKLLKKVRDLPDIVALPPGEALAHVEGWYEN